MNLGAAQLLEKNRFATVAVIYFVTSKQLHTHTVLHSESQGTLEVVSMTGLHRVAQKVSHLYFSITLKVCGTFPSN